MRRAATITREVIDEVFTQVKPGDTEKKVANQIINKLIEKGADEHGFLVLSTGKRSTLIHPIPQFKMVKWLKSISVVILADIIQTLRELTFIEPLCIDQQSESGYHLEELILITNGEPEILTGSTLSELPLFVK